MEKEKDGNENLSGQADYLLLFYVAGDVYPKMSRPESRGDDSAYAASYCA